MIFLDPLNVAYANILEIQVDGRLSKEAVLIYLDIISRIKKKMCVIKQHNMLGFMLKQYINCIPELVRFGYLIKIPRPKKTPRNESNRYVIFGKPILTHKMSPSDWESVQCADYSMYEFKNLYANVDEKLIEWKDQIKV